MAERLPAEDGWADAIVAGQAFHWFATEPALAEFARCLRPVGRLGLIWNRRSADDELQRRITALLNRCAATHHATPWAPGAEVFERPGPFTQVDGFSSEFTQELSRDGLLDRVGSISFVAALEPEPRAELLARVGELCTDGETVELPYVCEAFVYGRAA